MPTDGLQTTSLILPRVSAAIAGLALFIPGLRLPLVLGCLAALGNLALSHNRADNVVPEVPPLAKRPRGGARPNSQSVTSTEDSFPASDPPSWTPISGPGTQH
jgi:hypothetical protein